MEADNLLLKSLEELTNVAYGRPTGPLMPLIDELRAYLREFTDLVSEPDTTEVATKEYVDKIYNDLDYFTNKTLISHPVPHQYFDDDTGRRWNHNALRNFQPTLTMTTVAEPFEQSLTGEIEEYWNRYRQHFRADPVGAINDAITTATVAEPVAQTGDADLREYWSPRAVTEAPEIRINPITQYVEFNTGDDWARIDPISRTEEFRVGQLRNNPLTGATELWNGTAWIRSPY